MSDENHRVIVYRARSIIERDALMNLLDENQIECSSHDRDISRKYTNNSLDIAFEGYSATMGGFPIFTHINDSASAKKIIETFLKEIEPVKSGSEEESVEYLSRFYGASLFSVALPFLIPFSLYYLFKGLTRGEEIQRFKFIGSLFLTSLALIATYLGIQYLNWSEIFSIVRGRW